MISLMLIGTMKSVSSLELLQVIVELEHKITQITNNTTVNNRMD